MGVGITVGQDKWLEYLAKSEWLKYIYLFSLFKINRLVYSKDKV